MEKIRLTPQEKKEINNIAFQLAKEIRWPYEQDISQVLFVFYTRPGTWQFRPLLAMAWAMREKCANVDVRPMVDMQLPISALPAIAVVQGGRATKFFSFRRPWIVDALAMLGSELHPDNLKQYEQDKKVEEAAEKDQGVKAQRRERRERREMRRLIQYVEAHGSLAADLKRAIVAPMKRELGIKFDIPE